jgi:hemerythrin-like domain-containing protein
MKRDITTALVREHVLIKRMLALLEQNAPRTATGSHAGYRFYLDGVDFIRNYADRFHHAKEEDVLFAALIANGMPREHSPVAAMLMEHEQGRAFVRAMEEAAQAAMAGEPGQERLIAANALAYAALLREHIAKEDDILYPLTERIIPEEARDAILAGYARAEESAPAGFEDHYGALVARYEAEALAHAA